MSTVAVCRFLEGNILYVSLPTVDDSCALGSLLVKWSMIYLHSAPVALLVSWTIFFPFSIPELVTDDFQTLSFYSYKYLRIVVQLLCKDAKALQSLNVFLFCVCPSLLCQCGTIFHFIFFRFLSLLWKYGTWIPYHTMSPHHKSPPKSPKKLLWNQLRVFVPLSFLSEVIARLSFLIFLFLQF